MKRIFNLFSKENSLRGASIILIVTLTISNLLGLIRDRILTHYIATSNLDIYYAAFRIPDLIFNFLVLGAITSAFIPIFSDYLTKGEEEEGFRVTNILINLALVLMIFSAVTLYYLMPYLMPLVAPNFDAVRMALAVKYARLIMLTPVFFSVSYIIGAVLNCHKRFLAYSLAPIFYNCAIIISAAYLAPRYGVIGVIYGVVAGAFLHMLVQVVPVMRLGFRWQPIISITEKPIRRIIRLMVPRTISMGSNQIMLIVYTAIASMLAVGSISAFNLATNIQTMPVVVLGTSFATAIFPTLAKKISANEPGEFSYYLNHTLRIMGYLLIPSTVFFILMRAQIIRLILGSGKFTWDDTRTTALTLGFLSISILAAGVIPLLSKAFYALKNTRTPMYISIATTIISVTIGYPLARAMSVSGLALAFSIGSYFNMIVLIHYLRKKYPGILNRSLIVSYTKTLLSSFVMGLVIYLSMHLAANFVDMTRFWGVFQQTLFAGLTGIVAYLIMGYITGQEEFSSIVKR
ncbi:murein biosynthesis integral membrane protein MurJ [Candidatus Berkelbacteria bacterium CG10_big_fil_rev_8_21_14_0_10_43_13]|uniref:Probable lipid II flippase MurJ n=1 Tax=Candidatus Berkelbacteria bacterium CG10_big_fil_rev_8_21_14_0_10_43_13 TaxID=1974514 RepID=A0A2H0W5M2_9BACT|nr:MAG: murein biosynthesis integral membrane protein MurJ [Candidatus Berkelbacteria bacterium CG10_big_fil_rev_8_21_14_0_10_43_13]